MMARGLSCIALCLVGLCMPATAWAGSSAPAQAAEPMELQPIDGGVRVVDRAGQTLVEHLHPALFPEPRRYREGRDGRRPVGPIEADGAFYYALGHDLLRFDVDAQALTSRRRMPATVVGLEEGDDGALRVALEAFAYAAAPTGEEGQEDDWVVIDVRPDQAEVPGRGPWDWAGTMAPLRDVMWLDGVPLEAEPGASAEPVRRDQEEERGLIEELEERERFDRTNPYLALYRGEAWLRMGDEDRAQRAFEQALGHEEADWIDLIRITMRLEYGGHADLAKAAFERAVEEMERAGVRGDYVLTMANATFGMVWHGEAMRRALRDEDLDGAHRVAGYIDGFFPNLEGAPLAWSRLAIWQEERRGTEQARHWEERAAELRQSPRADTFYERAAQRVDWYLTGQLALFVTVLLAGAILGLRRRCETENESDVEDRRFWVRLMPRFYLGDVAALVLLFVVLLALPMTLGPPLHSMVTFAEAPAAVGGDAMAAPTTPRWLDGLADSPAKDALVAEWESEFAATREGGRGPGEAAVDRLIVETIEADTGAQAPRSFSELEASPGTTQDFPWLGPLLDFGHSLRGATLLFLVLAINALIFGGLLQAVIRRVPGVGRIGRALIPGGPESLGPFRLPLLAAFLFGLAMMTPLSRAAQSITEAELVRYYGLESAPSTIGTALPTTGFAIITVALVIHAIGVVTDRRRRN